MPNPPSPSKAPKFKWQFFFLIPRLSFFLLLVFEMPLSFCFSHQFPKSLPLTFSGGGGSIIHHISILRQASNKKLVLKDDYG